jgi:ABC-type branched-subunit amino acid transport system permease subunit
MQTTPTTFKGLVDFIISFLNILIPALFGVLFLYIVWRIIDAWILHADNETKREEGKRLVITAVLVFVLMISTWGIVAMIKQSLFN